MIDAVHFLASPDWPRAALLLSPPHGSGPRGAHDMDMASVKDIVARSFV